MAEPNLPGYSTAAAVKSSLDKAGTALQIKDLGAIVTPDSINAVSTNDILTYAALKSGYERGGVIANGSHPALVVVDPPPFTSEFTLKLPIIVLKSFAPSVAVTLFDSVSSNTGIRISLEATGLLTVAFGDGTNLTTYVYTSTDPIALGPYSPAEIVVTCKRAGNLSFYVNGSQLGSEVNCSASSAVDLGSSKWRVLSDGTTHYAGFVYEQMALVNAALSPSEVGFHWNVPDLWRPVDGSTAFSYTSDFSSSPSPWSNVSSSAVLAPRTAEDGVTQCLRISGSTVNTAHIANMPVDIVAGTQLTITFDVYVGSANSAYTDGFLLSLRNSTYNYDQDIASVRIGDGLAAGWNSFSVNAVAEFDATSLRLYMTSGGNSTFVSSPADELFLKNIVIKHIASTLYVNSAVGDIQKQSLAQGLAYSLSTPTNVAAESTIYSDVTWASSSATKNILDLGIPVLSGSDYIEAIFVKSTNSGIFSIGDESDKSRYISEATIGQEWGSLPLVTHMSDGSHLEITATPMDGAGSAQSRTDTISIAVVIRRL